ncbi:hypothetical protein [Nitrosophilus labii]|uniref:hypothetical protein n=1 Tax=Nitrosophilus labii TaxID=2706014 RepID=UPI001656AC06|nr:hypothetical protein [Nitrosophilus labii]
MKWSIKLIFILSASFIYADSLVIAANRNFPADTLNRKTVQKIYLDKIRFLGEKKIIPINLPYDHLLRKKFENIILKMKRFELERYWLQTHYMGHRPPKVLKSQEAIASFLKNVDNAIGYLEKDVATKHKLKILYEVQNGESKPKK